MNGKWEKKGIGTGRNIELQTKIKSKKGKG